MNFHEKKERNDEIKKIRDTREKIERNRQINKMYDERHTQQEIAEIFKISRSRIQQLVNLRRN